MNDQDAGAGLAGLAAPAPRPGDPPVLWTWRLAADRLAPSRRAEADLFLGFAFFLARLPRRDAIPTGDRLAFLDHVGRALLAAEAGDTPRPLPYGLDRPIAASAALRRCAPPLLQACKREIELRDSGRPEFLDWSEMNNWLRFSAVPVGRFLLDLHDESDGAAPAMDGLAMATGLCGRLQEAAAQAHEGRIAMPAQWLTQAGLDRRAWLAVGRGSGAAGREIRVGARKALLIGAARVEQLLAPTELLPRRLADPRLRRLAERLPRLLRRLSRRAASRTTAVTAILPGWLDRLSLR